MSIERSEISTLIGKTIESISFERVGRDNDFVDFYKFMDKDGAVIFSGNSDEIFDQSGERFNNDLASAQTSD